MGCACFLLLSGHTHCPPQATRHIPHRGYMSALQKQVTVQLRHLAKLKCHQSQALAG